MRIEDAWAKLHEAARLAAARGSLIFHLDLATEVARVAFRERGIGEDRLATMVDDRGYRVFAFDEAPAPRALSEARFDDAGDAIVLTAPEAVPPRAWTLAEGRRTIGKAYPDDKHVGIIVPVSDPRAPIEGYALAVADSPGTAIVAGHWLLTLDPPGRRIIARQPIAAAIDAAPRDLRALREAPLIDAGAVPNEIHVYLSLKHGVPLLIETQESRARWRVDGERVTVV